MEADWSSFDQKTNKRQFLLAIFGWGEKVQQWGEMVQVIAKNGPSEKLFTKHTNL